MQCIDNVCSHRWKVWDPVKEQEEAVIENQWLASLSYTDGDESEAEEDEAHAESTERGALFCLSRYLPGDMIR